MDSWNDFATAEPEMAQHGLALLEQRGAGEGFFATVAAHGTPRINVLNVGVRDGRAPLPTGGRALRPIRARHAPVPRQIHIRPLPARSGGSSSGPRRGRGEGAPEHVERADWSP